MKHERRPWLGDAISKTIDVNGIKVLVYAQKCDTAPTYEVVVNVPANAFDKEPSPGQISTIASKAISEFDMMIWDEEGKK